MPNRTTPEFKELARQVGQFIQYWGFKRVHGEIWLYVFLAQQPIDATTLVKRLGVSKALVSLAIKDLMKYNVIRVAGKGGRRKILFESNPNMLSVIANVLREREQRLLANITEAHAVMTTKMKPDSGADIDPEKLAELGEMIDTANKTLSFLLDSNLDLLKKS